VWWFLPRGRVFQRQRGLVSNNGAWGHDLAEPFVRGGDISFDVEINAHHLGHFEFYVCNRNGDESDAAETTPACLNRHRLQRAPDLQGEVSPLDPNHPERYYIPPLCSLDASGPALNNPLVQNMRYVLPPDLVCDHCVLQMVYVTGNSCNPEGYRHYAWPTLAKTCPGASGDGARDWWNNRVQDCSDGGYPEEFWNCADIRIVAVGGSPGPNLPSPTTMPTVDGSPGPNLPSPTTMPTVGTVVDDTPPPTHSVPTPGEDIPCIFQYGACGGGSWDGTSSCCTASAVPEGEGELICMQKSQYYSQCLSATSCQSTGWCVWPTDGSDGAPTPAPSPRSEPQPTPTPACNTQCTDNPTPWMIENNQECATSTAPATKCNQNGWWTENQYCQQTCWENGDGYAGVECCQSSTLPPTPLTGDGEDGQCVANYGTCSSEAGASSCCAGDSGEDVSCREQSQYYSQCLSAEDCLRTDWCHLGPATPTTNPTGVPTTSLQPPTHLPTASPQPPTVAPPPTTLSPTSSDVPPATLSTDLVGDSYDRYIEFLDELTTTLDTNDAATRVVQSSGGAAGGVVSEGQGYGLLIGGATAASLASTTGTRSEAFDYSVETTMELFRGWQQMCVRSDSRASCQQGSGPLCTYVDRGSGSSEPLSRQVPCLPHWKFNNDLTVVEGAGAAVDGDEDAILGMILLLKAVEPFRGDSSNSDFAWYEEVAQWVYESTQSFYAFNTVASGLTGERVVRLGSCWGGWDCNNPSYHAPAAMKSMRDFVRTTAVSLGYVDAATAAAFAINIDAVVDVTYQILLANQCPSNGLATNWYVPDEQNPAQTGTTGCSGSGTPAAEFGSEASRGVWRVVLDYVMYSEPRAVAYLNSLTQNVVSQYRPEEDPSSQWGDLDFQTATGSSCLVESVHASWQWNAFMFGPVFTSLIVPRVGTSNADLNIQTRALDSAAARIQGTVVSDYYSGSWVAISTLTLNGDFLEAASLF